MTSPSAHRRCVAVVGPGEGAPADAVADAEAVGRLLAGRGWVTLCGGRAAGVMAAAARGAAAAGGLAVGLLPGADRADAAPGLAAALPTGLGEARNAVLVTAADAVVGCGMNPGTASEVALALRAGKPTALVRPAPDAAAFFAALAGAAPLHLAETAEQAVAWVAARLGAA
jgi:hypothetical protein